MKTNLGHWGALCISAFFVYPLAAASADTNGPNVLTIELRDGSRIVGTSTEKKFKFHSALLDDFKLAVNDIRSIDFVSSNTAKLCTAKGDTLTVSFAESEITIKTTFGKTELSQDLIRNIEVRPVSKFGGLPEGLVALWSGEGNGRDSVGGNDAVLTDTTFADGKVGQAFSLNGFCSFLKAPFHPANATDTGLTVTTWIKPSSSAGYHPIFQWRIPGIPYVPLDLRMGHSPNDVGIIYGNFIDENQSLYELISPPGMVIGGEFQFVAFTYNRASGEALLYLNGVVVSRAHMNAPLENLSRGNFYIGHSDDEDTPPGSWSSGKYFAGLLDEVALYNRALTAEEIQAVCRAQNHGD
jgi:hypothetical protein